MSFDPIYMGGGGTLLIPEGYGYGLLDLVKHALAHKVEASLPGPYTAVLRRVLPKVIAPVKSVANCILCKILFLCRYEIRNNFAIDLLNLQFIEAL